MSASPDLLTVRNGNAFDVLRELPDGMARCCVTSPPYWGLRDYGTPPIRFESVTFTPASGLPPMTVPEWEGHLGLEPDPWAFVGHMVALFREVRRVLSDNGTLWVNLGDTYATGAGKVGNCPGGGEQGTKWAGHHPGRMRHNGLATRAGAAMGPMTQPNRMPIEGLKAKDLVGIPWRVALALQADGWYLRSDIIWNKPSPMPESVRDRPTKAHEYIFLLSKSESYFYDQDAVKEVSICGHRGSSFTSESDLLTKRRVGKHPRPSQAKGSFRGKTEAVAATGQNAFRAVTETRNKRSVWTVATRPYREAHFATFPPDLIKPCILAGSLPGDVVLDPFGGSGTTGQVALDLGRKAVLIELNPQYVRLIEQRCNVTPGLPLQAA